MSLIKSLLADYGFKEKGNSGIYIKGNAEFWKSGYTQKYIYKENKNDFLKPEHIFNTVEEFINHLESKTT